MAEDQAIQPGQPFTAGLHITLDEGWHTYWRNAGDAGNGASIRWDLPPGFTAESLRYPRPERIPYPPLLNYGYEDEVVLLTTITPPDDLEPGQTVSLNGRADFLVCEDICIPASAPISLDLPVRAGEPGASEAADLIRRYRAQLPVQTHEWAFRAARTDSGFVLGARPPAGWTGEFADTYFYPFDPTTLRHAPTQEAGVREGELRLRLPQSEYLAETPDRLEGILVLPEGSSVEDGGRRAMVVSAPVEPAAVAWASQSTTPVAGQAPASPGAASAGSASLSVLLALVFAFVGGLILNLMPCVFPILSLKALGFASHGGNRDGMRKDGLAFGAGVVLTFLVVAGLLLAVRAGGAQVGWGYQLQNPAIVALLAALMFGIGLWLAGVVEFGASFTRVGGMASAPAGGEPSAGRRDGMASAFFTGALATVVATPCTAPFMGAAIGAALVRPPAEALLIFAALGVGMATPYVALSFWPGLADRLPRPGRWMETFKQLLAFPMFAVAIWLVWVFGLQTGMGGAARLLFGLLLLALAAWVVGRWPATTASRRVRLVTRGTAAGLLVVALLSGTAAVRGAEPLPAGPAASAAGGADASGVAGSGAEEVVWEPYSKTAIDTYRAEGRPVFIDFTAAWCISCQVNERVALETETVQRAFQRHNVALLKADWTRRDPAITRALESFGRAGVPLYVLYPADPAAEPLVLPELLTRDIVLNALEQATS